MTTPTLISFRWPVPAPEDGAEPPAPIDVEYVDGAVVCTRDGQPAGEYTMGVTTIVGSTLIDTDTRRDIFREIQRCLWNIAALG